MMVVIYNEVNKKASLKIQVFSGKPFLYKNLFKVYYETPFFSSVGFCHSVNIIDTSKNHGKGENGDEKNKTDPDRSITYHGTQCVYGLRKQ